MSRKVLALLLLSVAVLVIVLSVSLNSIVGKSRARIEEDLERALGRDVSFGDLKLSLWNGPGVAATDVKIAEDPSFAATPFLQAKQVRMQLRWLPLFAGRLRIEKFILEEPEIQIIKNEAGLLNIAALTAAAREKKSKPNLEGKSDLAGEKKPPAAPRLVITNIQITNGNVDYIDRAGREPVEVRMRRLNVTAAGALNSPAQVKLTAELFEGQGRNLSVEGEAGPLAGRPWSQAPLNVKLRCDSLLLAQLAHAVPPLRPLLSGYVEASGPIAFESRLQGSIDRPRFVDLHATGTLFGATSNNTTLKGDLDFTRPGPRENGVVKLRLTVDPLPLEQMKTLPFLPLAPPASLLMQGPVSVTADLQGTLAALNIRAAVKATQSEIVYGNWFKKAKGVAADLLLDLERRPESLLFRDSTISLNHTQVKFSGALESAPRRLLLNVNADALPIASFEKLLLPLGGYNLGGRISARFALAKPLEASAGLEVRGSATLDNIEIKERRSGRGVERATGQIVFRGKEARIERLVLRSGASDIAAEAAVADLSVPALRFSLRSAKLKPASLYAAPFSKADEMNSLASAGELALRDGKPWLRAGVSSSAGVLMQLPYRNLRGDIVWTPATAEFKNVAVQTLGGSVRSSGSWDASDRNLPRLAVEPTIDAIDLNARSKQNLFGIENHLDGRLSLKGKFRAQGKNASALPQELSGAGETQIRNGALKNVNLPRLVLARLLGAAPRRWPQRLAPLADRKDTPFDVLTANFTVQEGRAHSKNLLLSGSEYSIRGEGSVGLDKTLQWDTLLTLSSDLTQEVAGEHSELRAMVDREGRLSVPFQVGGRLGHVQVISRPDRMRQP